MVASDVKYRDTFVIAALCSILHSLPRVGLLNMDVVDRVVGP